MNIKTLIAPIRDANNLITRLLTSEFGISHSNAVEVVDKSIADHFSRFNPNTFLVAETQYVDKVYRDSYYNYYSSKLSRYHRNCIRISIFADEINETILRNGDSLSYLEDNYRGFIVLRPTEPFFVGRSIIDPRIIKDNGYKICTGRFNSSIKGRKLTAIGFPHSSQETETITCAETTIWSLMEYFGNRYPEYKPVLPTNIHTSLTYVTNERQLPSKGLTIRQISFSLKGFGFGTQIYSLKDYGLDFNRLLSCYVESGIPIIIGMDNFETGNIGHAMLCIGHENINSEHIERLNPNSFLNSSLKQEVELKSIVLYDYDCVDKQFIFVDDNCPVYQSASLQSPAKHYHESEWQSCTIKHFIAPLYPKIYLEAFKAKNFAINFLLFGPIPINNNSELLIRMFLASSRSYKHYISLSTSMDSDLRDILLEKPMPKFIWVGELSGKDLMKRKLANGLLIIDATEANTLNYKPLIYAAYQDRSVDFNERQEVVEKKLLTLSPFLIFENNLS